MVVGVVLVVMLGEGTHEGGAWGVDGGEQGVVEGQGAAQCHVLWAQCHGLLGTIAMWHSNHRCRHALGQANNRLSIHCFWGAAEAAGLPDDLEESLYSPVWPRGIQLQGRTNILCIKRRQHNFPSLVFSHPKCF